MNMDRQILAGFWLVVAAMVTAAQEVLGGNSSIFSMRMRQTANRLIRMTKFMVQRLCVAEALLRLSGDESTPEHIVPPGVYQLKRIVPYKNEVKLANDQVSPDRILNVPKIALIEPAYRLPKETKRAVVERSKQHPYAMVDPEEHHRLCLKIEALHAAISDRSQRVETLMAWFAARREDGQNPYTLALWPSPLPEASTVW